MTRARAIDVHRVAGVAFAHQRFAAAESNRYDLARELVKRLWWELAKKW